MFQSNRITAWGACLLAAGLIFTSLEGRCDDVGAELRDFTLRTWSKTDGLPDGSVTCIQQTQDGYLWVGTTAGLVRFDGIKFTPVFVSRVREKPIVSITALCEDTSGCVWVGTEEHGLFSWNNGQVRHYGTAEGLLDNDVTSLTLDGDGHLWIGTRSGVNRRNGDRFAAFTMREGLPNDSVSSVHAARSGTVWITTAGGMCRFMNGRISRFQFPTSGKERQDDFLGVYEDRRGNLWAFCATYIINLAEGNKRINYFGGEKSAMTRVWSLCEGRNGELWIGASGRGVFGFDGTRIHPVTLSEGRWPNDVRTICEDRDGDLWLGISDGVLAQLRPQRIALLTGARGLPAGAATCVTADAPGRVYVGIDSGGLYTGTGDRFERLGDDTKWLGQDLVSSACAQSDNSLWVGTTGSGLYHIKDGRTVVYTTANGLSDDCVTALCEGENGAIWAGTRAGELQRFELGRFTTFASADGLPGALITALLAARTGGLWVGTERGAVMRSDEHFHDVSVAKLAPKLADKPVLALCEGEAGKALWIGSAGGGLGCLWEGRCLAWDSTDGLPDDTVSGIVEDAEGNLWLEMSRGLCRVASNAVASALSGNGALKPKLMYETDPGTDRTPIPGWPHAVRSPEGKLWFATVNGLIGIDTHGWEAETPPPQVHIEAVYVNNTSVPLTGMGKAPLNFLAGLGSLELHVTALSFEAPEKIRFRHKLDGLDSDWVETGPERNVRYGQLPSGTYTFHVTACNAEGVWNDHGVSLSFIIPTPLWRRPWALILYGMAATTGAAATVRIASLRRLRRRLAGLEQQQAMERERMRIARNMHDEIGSKLTKISFLSERLKVESVKNGSAGDKVDSIATTSRDLLKALDEMVWAVNPRNDSLEHLASYLSQYASEYFQNTTVECDLRVQGDLPHRDLSAEFRHNVFLAFEESLSNVLKHSGATRVDVQIQFEEGTLTIRIKDNGLGFEAAAENGEGGRNGLKNMKQHLEDVGGSCVIQSRLGQGAGVELKVALETEHKEAI